MKTGYQILCLLGLSLLLVGSLAQSQYFKPFIVSTDFWEVENDAKDFEAHNFTEKFEVKNISETYKMFSGHITVRTQPLSKLFYLHVQAKNSGGAGALPLIVWLQGGPGCSSLFGAFMEIGPHSIDDFNMETGGTKYGNRRFHWAESNHLLFIDQPLGTGYSINDGNPVKSTSEAARDVHTFLKRFFEVHPNLLSSPVYLFGEGYAGHFIPAIAKEVWDNKATNHIKLGGVGIGNGWIDPVNQVSFWDYYAYSMGFVSTTGRDNLTDDQNSAMLDIINMNMETAHEIVLDIFERIQKLNEGMEIYNVKKFYQEKRDEGFFAQWARHPRTKAVFNVPEALEFTTCNQYVYYNFTNDFFRSYAFALQHIAGQVPILIYSGQEDFSVNTASTNNWLNLFNLPKAIDFRTTQKQLWEIEGDVVGAVQSKGNFYYAVVHNAGQKAAQDQPLILRDMLTHFINKDKVWVTNEVKSPKVEL